MVCKTGGRAVSHVPKYDDDSVRAWLYGTLLVALLAEKLIRHSKRRFPWGYDLAAPAQPVARLQAQESLKNLIGAPESMVNH